MQASGMLTISAPVTYFGMMWSSDLSLLTSVVAVCSDDTGRSLWSHHLSLIAMVGGVSPAAKRRCGRQAWSYWRRRKAFSL